MNLSDMNDTNDINDSDSDMNYTSGSDSNVSEANIESSMSDSDNNSDTAQGSNPWDAEYLRLIQSAICNLSVKTIHQIRSSHIVQYVSNAAQTEAVRILDNFQAILHPDSDNLEDYDEEELDQDLMIYVIRWQIPLHSRTVHKSSTEINRAN